MSENVAAPYYTAGKRWNNRRECWTRRHEVIRPNELIVEAIDEPTAKAFVCRHHYSGSFPAARLSVGLWRKQGPCVEKELLGVAVFSVPMQPNAIRLHCGVLPEQGVELGRFVCGEDVAFNGESYFLARALRILRNEKKDVRSVLSYADPLERRDPSTGMLTKPAHAGQIYQATSASFRGRGRPRTLILAPNGSVISDRTISKVRRDERGRAYAERQLVAAGADPRRPYESGEVWLRRILPRFPRVRHPGNFAYAFALGPVARRALGESLPYPRLAA